MKEKNGLICLFCKLIDRNRHPSCFKGMWIKNDWDKKFIVLRITEREFLDINHRDVFLMAGRCQDYMEV